MNCSAAWFIFGKRGDSMKKGALTNGLIGAIFIAVVSIALVLGLSRMDAAHTEASADAAGPYTPGTYTASADGFGGPVEVTVEVGKNGGITDITIKGDGETPEIGGAAIPELKKLALAAQSADIDVVTGASLTSGAVKTALSDALVQAGGEPAAVEAQPESAAAEGEAQAESGAAEVKAESAAAEGEAQAENAAAEGEAQAEAGEEADVAAGSADAALTPGTYTASADGFGGPVEVTVEVGSDGSIADVSIIGESETPEIGGAAIPELKKAALASQSADIDSVSGASLTSGAVKAALADALAQAAGGAGAADAQADGNEESGAAKAADGKKFIAGTYTATATGFGGDVDVTVTVTEDEITDVEITGDHETENIGSFAVDMLGDRILEAQSPNVDALTGATVTSKAIIRALKDALTEAGADLDAFPKPEDAEPELMEYEDLSTDIVIIGAGGAGMTAAIKAAQGGKDVILLEKMPYAGGNTTKATGGMNAAETHYQAEQGIEDSVEQFIEDTMKGGHDINDIDLVTAMAENSAEGIDWLDSIGAPLPKVSFSGGATNPRIHAPEDGSGVGAYLVTAFLKKLDELNVNIMYDTKATNLITLEGAVIGVQAESPTTFYTIYADAVILATGGFGNNEDMIVEYRNDLKGTVTTSAPGITGDGILMAEAVGADLVDIDQIQLHPTVEQGTSMLITESVRGDGAILVNQDGKRFTNELLTRDVVSAAELEQPGSYAYIIFDQRLRDGLKAIEKYVSTGITKQADTIEGLAEQLDIDPATLADTLATWNKYVADQKDPDFGRDTGMENDLSVAPFYAIKIAPGIHHTMGGVHIDTDARVIDTNGNVIPGLFAAGEVTGGVHGGNRIGGNAVADIVVFGTIASESAIAYCDEKAAEAEEVAGALADEAAEALEDEAAEALAGEAAEALEEEVTAAVTEEAAAAVAEEAAAAVAEEAAADSAAVSTAVPAESAAESAAAPAVESAAPAASTASAVESAAEPAPAQAA